MNAEKKYVIRSMTTTDYDVRTGEPVIPYHIYLMPANKRIGAYWSHSGEAERFDSFEAALAEARRSLKDFRFQIVPDKGERRFPNYWDR